MLSESIRQRIDRELAKFPADQRQSAVMPALTHLQAERGWISPETVQELADYLGMPAIAVQEVVTFYNMYNQRPLGRYKLNVCTNLPCQLGGGQGAAEYLAAKLGVEIGGTTADGMFTLQQSECLGACGDAPVALVNDLRMCSFLNKERLDQLIDTLRAEAAGEKQA